MPPVMPAVFRVLLCGSLAALSCASALAGSEKLLSEVISRTEKDPRFLDRYLTENPGSISATDSTGYSLILWAAQAGKADIVRRLTAAGADVNQVSDDREKVTPLVCASDRGWAETVGALLELGARVQGPAADRAVRAAGSYNTENHARTILVLAKAGADLDGTPVWKSLEYGRDKILAALLEGGAEVDQRGTNDMTPLITAVARPVLVKVILKHHPDLNARARFPFAFHGFPDIPPGERYREMTALMLAAEAGQLKTVRLLLEAGANAGEVDRDGRTAFVPAKAAGRSEVLPLLRETSAP